MERKNIWLRPPPTHPSPPPRPLLLLQATSSFKGDERDYLRNADIKYPPQQGRKGEKKSLSVKSNIKIVSNRNYQRADRFVLSDVVI